MRVGRIVVGAAIGGLLWVLVLRTSNAATRDDKPEQGGTPPPNPDGYVRDAQGNVVSTVVAKSPPNKVPPTGNPDESPVQSPPAGNTSDLIDIAASATDTTVVGYRTDGDAAIGNSSAAPASIQPMRVDPGTKTIEPDPLAVTTSSDQAPAVANPMAPAPAPPSYSLSTQYTDYMVARFGPNWQSLTNQQISQGLIEAAQIGGLPL